MSWTRPLRAVRSKKAPCYASLLCASAFVLVTGHGCLGQQPFSFAALLGSLLGTGPEDTRSRAGFIFLSLKAYHLQTEGLSATLGNLWLRNLMVLQLRP